jgi:hypothetical protein
MHPQGSKSTRLTERTILVLEEQGEFLFGANQYYKAYSRA